MAKHDIIKAEETARERAGAHRGADLLLGCGAVLGSFGGNCPYSCYLSASTIVEWIRRVGR